ncbi:MAG: cellulase family glycosylhydrolase [Chloroflexi bacterium]|nr:cellulase family glycosylhydrolase [Chloroflexota bacterium]
MKLSLAILLRLFSLLMIGSSTIGMIIVPDPITKPATSTNIIANPIPDTDVNPLGANFFLDREVELWKKEQTLKMAQEAGIGWVKVLFSWDSIEPRKGYFWDDRYKKSTWEKYDEMVELAEKYGMKIIARLDRPPDWTRQDNSFKTSPPDDFYDYADFVYAVVSRYKGRIQHYQIWNEPNIWPEWGNRPVDPKGYVELLKIAYQRAKLADPNALVLSAPLAQTLEKSPSNLNELDYLEAMYQAGAKDYFDILLANAYGFSLPPNDPPDPDRLNFARITLLREVMVRNGDTNKAVWINEFGWNAAPSDFPQDKLYWGRVSEKQQAEYTIEGINMARLWGWVGVINIWYFRQVGDISPWERADYYFRIVDIDFTPRLVYYKLRELANAWRVAPPGYHEETAPAVVSKGRWMSLLSPQASGGTAIASETAGDNLTLVFQGTDVELLGLGSAAGGRVYVTVDGKNPHLPNRDKDGRSYVDLFTSWNTLPSESQLQLFDPLRLPVAQALSPGRHTLQLTLAKESNSQSFGRLVVIDALVVKNQPRYQSFYGFVILSLLGFMGLGLSFLLRGWR